MRVPPELPHAYPFRFVETVLDYTMQSLRSDAALIVLREEDGTFKAVKKGHPALLTELSSRLHSAFADLVQTGGKETVTLTENPEVVSAIAAVIPGLGTSMGLLCLARDAAN